MAIDLNKPDNQDYNSQNSGPPPINQGDGSRLNYADPESSPKVREVYLKAIENKRQGMPDHLMEQSLMNQGLDFGDAQLVIGIINRRLAAAQNQVPQSESGGSKFPGWLIWIIALVVINVMSAAFGWGFWLY